MAQHEEQDIPEGVDTQEVLDQKSQIALAARLQSATLRTFLRRLENGTISDTGLSTLVRLLASNGWALDPKEMPEGLREKLTSLVDPKELDDDVLPFPGAKRVG